MKTPAGSWAGFCLALVLIAVLNLLFRGCSGPVIVTGPKPEIRMSADPDEPVMLAPGDGALLARLMPVIDKRVNRLIQAEFEKAAAELDATDPTDPQKLGGFGFLSASIIWFVKKALAAAVTAIIVTALLALLWSLWPWILGTVLGWLGITIVVSRATAKGVLADVRKEGG